VNETIRVGLDVTPLLGPPSGIHQVTKGLLNALRERDDVIVSGWLLSARGHTSDLGVDIHHARLPAQLIQRCWRHSTFPGTERIAGPVNVVHGTNFIAPPSSKSIISVQDLTPITHPEWVRSEVRAKAGALRNAVRHGAIVHTSSQAIADEAAAVLGISEQQLAVVHHGVRQVDDAPSDLAFELSGTDRFVLVLGTVERRKNIEAAVHALGALPHDVHLVIAGPEGNSEPEVQGAIRESGNTDRIVRLTNVSVAEHAALIRHATVLCFPSLYEGFGLPPLEALRVGTPVVATAVGALPELISDRVPLISPGDTVALTEALVAVVEDPSVDPAVVNRITGMTWERAAGEMTAVYQRVAADVD